MADGLDFLMRQREEPLAGNRGAGMAGFALGGGNTPRAEQMRAQGLLTGARASDAMAQARQRQQQEVARANLAERYRTQGDPDLGDMVAGGINPNEYAEADINRQRAKILADTYTRATGKNPDRNMINLLMQVYSGKPEKLTDVAGGMAFNPQVTPDQSQMAPTSVGLADIAEKHAQASSAGAAAGEHSALADLARARTDKVKEEVTAPKTGKALSREQALSAFGKPDRQGVMQTDPQKYEDFLYFQKKNAMQDPRYLDANYALIQYKGGEASRQAGLADMAAQDESDQYARTYHGGSSAPPTPPEQPLGGEGLHTLFDGQPTPSEANASPAAKSANKPAGKPRVVVRTGKTKDGKKVVKYDDGTIETAP